MNNLSKNAAYKLGKRIRTEFQNGKVEKKSLSDLQNYRTSHKKSLSEVFNILLVLRKKVNREAIVTYRIKRLNSIINKLSRFETMKLSGMWDIGGCRIILNNNDEIYRFRDAIAKELNIRKTKDHIKDPKPDGYKSLHLYVDNPKDDKIVEIQLRNRQDHNWATLVEISDLLFKSNLKEYGKDKKLLKFHFLLSNIETLSINDKITLAKIIKKYNYIDELSKVFSRNYLVVRAQWLLIEREYRHRFFLIETSKDEVPKIEAFDNFHIAERKYFEKFDINTNANVVLTHLPKPNYEQISVAYSNYILTMHSFMDIFINLYETLIIDALKKGKFIKFRSYFNTHYNITTQFLISIIEEVGYSKTLFENVTEKERRRLRKKENEWKKEIQKKLKQSQKNLNRFQRNYQKHIPKNKIPRFITKRILKRTFKKYSKKIKKHLLQQSV